MTQGAVFAGLGNIRHGADALGVIADPDAQLVITVLCLHRSHRDLHCLIIPPHIQLDGRALRICDGFNHVVLVVGRLSVDGFNVVS